MNRKHFLRQSFLTLPVLSQFSLSHAPSNNPDPFVVKAGQSRFGDNIKFMGLHPNDLKISAKDSGGQLSVFDYTGHAKIGPPMHIHFEQDETFMVIAGKYRFVVGEQVHELSPGDTIFLPRGIPHTWIQLTDFGRMIYFLQPAGKMEEFFLKMNQFKEPPSQAELERIHIEHQMKLVGPPLQL